MITVIHPIKLSDIHPGDLLKALNLPNIEDGDYRVVYFDEEHGLVIRTETTQVEQTVERLEDYVDEEGHLLGLSKIIINPTPVKPPMGIDILKWT